MSQIKLNLIICCSKYLVAYVRGGTLTKLKPICNFTFTKATVTNEIEGAPYSIKLPKINFFNLFLLTNHTSF
jgi:hypothetical protein